MPSRNARKSLSVSSWTVLPVCSEEVDVMVLVSLLGVSGFVFGFCADAEPNARTMRTLKAHPRTKPDFHLLPINNELTFVLSLTLSGSHPGFSGSIFQAELHDAAADGDPYEH